MPKQFNAAKYPTPSRSATPRTPYTPTLGSIARMVASAAGREMAGKAAQAVGRYAASKLKGRGSSTTKPSVKRRLFSSRRFHTVGQYAGKFKKGRKVKPDKFLQYGFRHTVETTGIVDDPDCVYLGVSSHSSTGSLALMMHCLLRKIFRLSGTDLTSVDQTIPGIIFDCYTLRLTRENKLTGALSSTDHIIAVGASIFSIIGDGLVTAGSWGGILSFFRDYAQFQTAADQQTSVPKELILLRRDSTADNYLPIVNIVLENEMVSFRSANYLKIQNRTLAYTGSTDAEDVSNNPLMGRMYQMSAGAPRLRVDGARWLEAVDDAGGVMLARATQFLPANNFREPPPPNVFRDVVKSSRIKLEPGQIKYCRAKYSFTMPLLKFVANMWVGTSGSGHGASYAQNKLRGACTVVALEDMINVNGTSKINVAYEANLTLAAMLWTKGPSVALGKLTTHTYNMLAP